MRGKKKKGGGGGDEAGRMITPLLGSVEVTLGR